MPDGTGEVGPHYIGGRCNGGVRILERNGRNRDLYSTD